MPSTRRIAIWVIVIGTGIGIWYFTQGIDRNSGDREPEFFELPMTISSIGDSPMEKYDPVTIVLTLNCRLSSLDPGCGADPLFASMGEGCVWVTTDRLNLVNHKVFNSGYEEARWELRLWEDGPLWLTLADHLSPTCSTAPENVRRFVGSIHVSYRETLD